MVNPKIWIIRISELHMNEYLKFNQTTISDFSDNNVFAMYNDGYVFTRLDRGVMDQTRSVRIDLSKFEMSSENRRIYKKMELFTGVAADIPYPHYIWQIGKMAKDFYDTKFGPGTFSANKVKEVITDADKSNFNMLMVYRSVDTSVTRMTQGDEYPVSTPILTREQDATLAEGYAICFETYDMMHYSYPFYDLDTDNKNMGMSMMLYAILWAKNWGKKYIYLGSAQRPTDTYKLQFKGLEWFDGEKWQNDMDELKKVLKE